MATVNEALFALKDRMLALPTYGKTPAAVLVHPTETANLKKIVTFPTIVIGEMVTDERTWTFPTFGVGRDLWRAAINIYLTNETQPALGPGETELITLHEGWPLAVTSAIMAAHTLPYEGSKTADLIGEGGDVRMSYMIGGLPWNLEVYWGVHFAIPIWQEHIQEFTP